MQSLAERVPHIFFGHDEGSNLDYNGVAAPLQGRFSLEKAEH